MIEIQDLTVRLGDRIALQEVSFSAGQGDFVAILGPNGGGKSTLLRTILGLVRPQAGTVKVLNRPSTPEPRDVSYVPQIKALDRTFPARAIELVLTSEFGKWPGWTGAQRRGVAAAALARIGAGHLSARPISSLSGGELQRIYLARALHQQPRILLLDEPESGIDIAGMRDLYSLLERFREESGGVIVMATHDWDVARHHATHVLLLNGRQIAFGTPSEALTESAVQNTFGHEGHKHGSLAAGVHPHGGGDRV